MSTLLLRTIQRPNHARAWRNLHRSINYSASRASASTQSTLSGSPFAIKNVLLVQKLQDAKVSRAVDQVVNHIHDKYPHVHIFHEASPLHPADPPQNTEVYQHRGAQEDKPSIDLVITLGGDGTILHASSLFSNGPVPPVLSFSLGTLGFLLPFSFDTLEQALSDVFHGRVSILPRMRLMCTMKTAEGVEKPRKNSIGTKNIQKSLNQILGAEVMNEISLHRGRSPHLTSVDAYVDGQHLTAAVSDGLIVATPTGSTAYSLSSGGPIVHPSVSALLLTPVSPMSLSFRPLVLPGTSTVRLQMNKSSRTLAYISMDGRDVGKLYPGEYLEVAASKHPIPCIKRSNHPGEDHWVHDINTLLGFNVSFKRSNL
ncbi:ATP-NAD kinase [Clavulina sp. PMI_390]|nr:ATP-NAD kinase [Clavulina sp. PMI_390]